MQLRIIPAEGKPASQEVSSSIRDEIAELQASGEDSIEVVLGLMGIDPNAAVEERAIILRTEGAEGRIVTAEGLFRRPLRVPVKKSVVGTVQLLRDEINEIFRSGSL